MEGGGASYRRLVFLALFLVGAAGSAIGFYATRGRELEDYALLALALWFLYLAWRIPRAPLERIALHAVRTVGLFLLFTVYMALLHLPDEGIWPSLLWTAVIYPGVYVALPPVTAKRFLARYFALLVLVSTAAYLQVTRTHGFSLAHLNTHLQWLLSQTALLVLSTMIFEMGVRAARAEQAEREARTDPLTGLANRRRFLEAVESELRRSERSGRHPAVLMLDVDGLKEVNDRHGHLAGDRLLTLVADHLKRATRAGDLAARLGGDEFAVLLYDCNAETALRVAERLCRSIGGERVGEVPVSVSVGLAVARPSEEAGALLERADRALYQAKRAGGNLVVPAS